MMLRSIIFLAALFAGAQAQALTAAEAKAIATGDTDARIAALNQAMPNADERTAAFIQALSDDAIKLAGEQVILLKDGKAYDPVTGIEAAMPATLDDITNNNRMRGELDNALAALKLFSKDQALRAAAILELQGSNDDGRLPLIEKALATESVPALKDQLGLLRAAMLLGSADKSKRLQAATLLAQLARWQLDDHYVSARHHFISASSFSIFSVSSSLAASQAVVSRRSSFMSSRGTIHPSAQAVSARYSSISRMVTASPLSAQVHEASQGAGQTRPVNSGNGEVASSLSQAIFVSPR